MPATADREVLNFYAGPTASHLAHGFVEFDVSLPMARIEEYKPQVSGALSVTITVNHDVVDGTPGARFAETFGRLLEGGAGLDHGFVAEATELSGVRHALAR